MLIVLAIIVILTSLVVAVGGYVQKRSALARATGEISMLVSACESYKSDNGNYPRDTSGTTSKTDVINPKVDLNPIDPATKKKYEDSSLFLYMELSGDKTGSSNVPDGIPDDGQPRYLKDVEPRILKATRDTTTKAIISVQFLQDPFGFPYAYSTSAAKVEADFQTLLLQNPSLRATQSRKTGQALKGYNPGSFDLWSTGGKTTRKPGDTDEMIQANWVKNW